MADQAEQAFARAFLNTLSTQPITYADDYQQPAQNSLKRVPILQIAVPAPPIRQQPTASTSSQASITLVFKSLKPPTSYKLSVHPTDTISAIKSQLAALPSAPPADVQRLLLKGKALSDGKLLKEYNIQDGDTVNLMVKPGFDWNTSNTGTNMDPSLAPSDALSASATLEPGSRPSGSRSKHQRIPSLVLSPSPSETSGVAEKDIMLTLDTTSISSPIVHSDLSTYHTTISKPEFWDRLYSFLRTEFVNDDDAQHAFEDYLLASKGELTASEVARIRDQVGVVGMAGT